MNTVSALEVSQLYELVLTAQDIKKLSEHTLISIVQDIYEVDFTVTKSPSTCNIHFYDFSFEVNRFDIGRKSVLWTNRIESSGLIFLPVVKIYNIADYVYTLFSYDMSKNLLIGHNEVKGLTITVDAKRDCLNDNGYFCFEVCKQLYENCIDTNLTKSIPVTQKILDLCSSKFSVQLRCSKLGNIYCPIDNKKSLLDNLLLFVETLKILPRFS